MSNGRFKSTFQTGVRLHFKSNYILLCVPVRHLFCVFQKTVIERPFYETPIFGIRRRGQLSIKPPSVFQPLASRKNGILTGDLRHFRPNKIRHLRNAETIETRRARRIFVLGNQGVMDGHIHGKRPFCGVCAGCPVILSIAKNLFLQPFHRSFALLRMTGSALATDPKRPFWRQIGVRVAAHLQR